MKNTLFSGWHFMRIFRLVFGFFAAAQFMENRDAISGLISVFFLYQAFTNTGCGVNECEAPINKKDNDNIEDVTFEEIKIK